MTAVESIIQDLALIAEQAHWAHSHGYWKAGHGLAAEHGTDLSKPENERMKGPLYDLQIGDHKARIAYQHAARTVSRTDLLLAACLLDDGVVLQPRLHPLSVYSGPAELVHTVGRAIWRARHLTGPHRPRLATIRRSLDRAVKGLSRALDLGAADGIAHNERMCKTCLIRPQAEREKADGSMRATRAGECETCATWRQRNKAPRPARLDHDVVNAARAAQARRRQRGEDWGAA